MDTLEAFVSALPKVELHVHLVGSASVETVLSLARRHPDRGVPASEEGLREFYVFRDFPHFIDVYQAVSRLISEPEDNADLVRGVAANLAAQNVRYAEFQFGPYAFQRIGMPDAVITEALDIGARYALAECGVRIGWIIEFPGQSAGDYAENALRLALQNPPEALVGFGVGGIEAGRAPYTAVIRTVFGAAAAAGLRCNPHAGETTGAETMWEAIEFLHADRIGHGIRSLDDPSLVAYLAERQLPATGLFEPLTSDAPPMFGTSLSNEYLVAG